MKTKIIAFILLALVCITSYSSLFASPVQEAQAAYGGLVQCDGVVDPTRTDQVKCDFTALMNQIKFLVNWLFYISVPIAIVLFAYSGFLYISGTPGNVSKAKGMFTTVGIGFALMCIAWFVIYTLLTWLTKGDQGFTTLLK